jgi:hypothetical protein
MRFHFPTCDSSQANHWYTNLCHSAQKIFIISLYCCLLRSFSCPRAYLLQSAVYIYLALLSFQQSLLLHHTSIEFTMASSQSANDLSQKMEKMSVNSKRHVDAPRYTPPHRKYAQASKAVETSTTAPAKDASKTSTPASSVTEKSATSKFVTSTRSESAEENKVSSISPSVAATDKVSESEPKHKPATRSIAPHHKYSKPTTTKVADSWEEEEASSEPQPSNTTNTTTKQASDTAPVPKSSYIPPHLKYRSAAPSPPSRSVTPPSRSTTPSSTAPSSTTSERRPEKTNAVAHRLIAGALGVKVPRRTEEQRAYDKAMREQEKRKRDQEREAKKKAEEDAAKAKAAIWDD